MNTRKLNINELMESTGVFFGTSGIRGLVTQMTDEVCYAYAKAFLRILFESYKEAGNVVIGHDLRPSSPRISAACASAVCDAGGEAIYVGALPTPAIAYYASKINAAAIVVTGSHIPFDRNGIKFYSSQGEISKADEHAIQNAIVQLPIALEKIKLGKIQYDAEANYIRRYVDFFGIGYFNNLNVALYEHSSVARDTLRKIFQSLGANVISLGRSDSFVPIDTEAVRLEDIEQAKNWAHKHNFDVILSTDGDADRPLIGDELGNWLRGDIVGILCAKFLDADVVVTPVSSNTMLEKSGWFKSVLRTRIGSPYVIEAMESVTDPAANIVGFEANGGFLLGSDVVRDNKKLARLPTRDALLPMFALLALAKESNLKLSELTSILPNRYTHSDRIQNFATAKSRELLELLIKDRKKIIEIMAPNSGEVFTIDETDGLRATFSNGDVVHLRPSGNAPELRCYAESDSQLRAQLLCKTCLEAISN